MRRAASMATAFLLITPAVTYAGDLTGTVKTKGARDSRDAVVFLKGVPGKFPPPEKHAVMDQKNLQFIPHVLPILAGTTVDFLNGDDVLHNVFTADKTFDRFNLGSWPKGEVRGYTFDAECDVICTPVILCNVHPEMEAYVVVLKNPYFGVTDKDGKFAIKGIPAGEYEIGLWHQKLKGEVSKVAVPDSGSVTVELNMHR